MRTPRRVVGDRGEAIAAGWYREHGYEVVAANVRAGRNELDLVCCTGDEVVFVEVKTGSPDEYGDPIHRVDRLKRRAILHAARRWLLAHPQGERGVRFDVLIVATNARPPRVEHLPGAFTADDA